MRKYLEGDKHQNWKGDKVGYSSLHEWMINHFPKPNKCSCCGKETDKLDLSNNGIYDRNIINWEYLCRKCHINKDGRNHKGEKNSQHKLTVEQVTEIRNNYKGERGELTLIGKKYGVSYWTISQLINYKTWK